MLALLAIAVLWMGVYPKPFTDVMHVSVSELLKHVAQAEAELMSHSPMNPMNWLRDLPRNRAAGDGLRHRAGRPVRHRSRSAGPPSG